MLDVWYFGDLKIEFIELIVDYRLIIGLFNVIEIVLRISFVDKEDSFIYFSFFFVSSIWDFDSILLGSGLVQMYSLQEIKWFYCSFRMSYEYVMNVPFLGGNWNKRRNEYLNSFFNFSMLTTARYWRDISNYNESMFWWNSLKFRRMIERLFRGDIFVRFKLYDEYEN